MMSEARMEEIVVEQTAKILATGQVTWAGDSELDGLIKKTIDDLFEGKAEWMLKERDEQNRDYKWDSPCPEIARGCTGNYKKSVRAAFLAVITASWDHMSYEDAIKHLRREAGLDGLTMEYLNEVGVQFQNQIEVNGQYFDRRDFGI